VALALSSCDILSGWNACVSATACVIITADGRGKAHRGWTDCVETNHDYTSCQ